MMTANGRTETFREALLYESAELPVSTHCGPLGNPYIGYD